MAPVSGGQTVVDSLLNEGVSQTFGLISVHTVHIYDALRGVQDRLSLVGCRHESAVVFMADGYSRASGKPGVCFTSTGPGAANSVGAMGEPITAHRQYSISRATASPHWSARVAAPFMSPRTSSACSAR